MNIDTNIFNKTPANKIQQHIKDIIQYEEVEFIPSMQGWFNIQKSINVIHHVNKERKKYMVKKKYMIILIDTQESIWQNF